MKPKWTLFVLIISLVMIPALLIAFGGVNSWMLKEVYSWHLVNLSIYRLHEMLENFVFSIFVLTTIGCLVASRIIKRKAKE